MYEIAVCAVIGLLITSRKLVSLPSTDTCVLLVCKSKATLRHPTDAACRVLNYDQTLYFNLKNLENNVRPGTNWKGGFRVGFMCRHLIALNS